MRPDYYQFVDELLRDIKHNTKTSWGKYELIEWIKDRRIKFLEKVVGIKEFDDDVPF